jgi:hemerythrin-like domain-containing protein
MFAISSQEVRARAQAAFVEHQILNHVKQALRVTLDWKAPAVSVPRKLSSVQFTAKSFQRHLLRMMSLEEEDGYMSVVRERNPNSEPRIKRLERDHRELRRQIAELAPEIEALPALDEARSEAVCAQIVKLLDCVDLHDGNEIELLQESMACDDGGEG